MWANSEQVGSWANSKPEVDVNEKGHFSTESKEAQCEYCLYRWHSQHTHEFLT